MSKPLLLTRRQLVAGAGAAIAFQPFGCASPVPGGNGLGALSGKSLNVTLSFAGPVNSTFYYYFLINNSNNSAATYPVPVGSPISGTTYGNGFATGSDGVSGGFTDFVLYSSRQYAGSQPNQGFALYHVANGTNANAANFVANGSPIQVASPQTSNSPNTIGFQIDLAQLFEYPNSGNTQAAAISQAQALRWVQINMVSTDIVPVDITTTVTKHFDSFGDDSNGVGSFLLMDLQDGGSAYVAGTPPSPTEPTGDVYVSPVGGVTSQLSALDLVNWNIQIIQSN